VAWFRLSYIGSVMYELPAAERAATAAGSTLGTANMTQEAFANAVWVMTVWSLGWIIVSALFTDKIGVIRDKVAAGSAAALTAISVAGGVGGMGYMALDRALPLFTPSTMTVIVGFVLMVALNTYAEKSKKLWPRQFGMMISMIGGMLVGAMMM
jgi:hypothetical protein